MHMLPSFYVIPLRNCDKRLYVNTIFGNYLKHEKT